MVWASPSAQIVDALAENHYTSGLDGREGDAYVLVMAVATAMIALGIVGMVAVGPEKKGLKFFQDELTGTEGAISSDDLEAGRTNETGVRAEEDEEKPSGSKAGEEDVKERCGSNSSSSSSSSNTQLLKERETG